MQTTSQVWFIWYIYCVSYCTILYYTHILPLLKDVNVAKWLKKWWLPQQEQKLTTNARVAASYGKSISCIFILCGTRLTRQCRNVQATGSTLGPLQQTLQWLLSLWTTRLSVADIGPTTPLGIDGLGSTTFKMLQKMINLLFYGAGRWVIHFNCT